MIPEEDIKGILEPDSETDKLKAEITSLKKQLSKAQAQLQQAGNEIVQLRDMCMAFEFTWRTLASAVPAAQFSQILNANILAAMQGPPKP